MTYRIGIDVGGTFTDFLLVDDRGRQRILKRLSTPDDPSIAVIEGFRELADAEGHVLEAFMPKVSRIVHGTTVTTNAVLTGNIATTGLLATRGFRDALQMRRGVREELYNNKYHPPPPPVPRWRRLPVTERIDQTGAIISALDLKDVDAGVEILKQAGCEAIAICFLHAYANDSHEQAVAARVRDLMPEAYVSVSSEILPQVRFYERTSTTVLNAGVGPILKRYLVQLLARLGEAKFAGTLLIMQSNGGVASPAHAIERPAATLLSGPAAGPVAGRTCAAGHGHPDFITIDMGGTSFEASLAQKGAAAVTTAATVNGYAMALPSLDIKTIGAGGGSVAWIDGGGLLRMGPKSAGAQPGPACYDLGGSEPTCTDANLLLGFLSAEYFAGGRMRLSVDGAQRAIERYIAEPLQLTPIAAAAGMYRIMNVNMASAIREISIERGHDPRQFPLVCAGGAGAVHAVAIARELGIGRILVPRQASILCAAGMLQTDLQHDYVRSYATAFTADALDQGHLLSLLRDMEAAANTTLEAEGVPPDRRRFRYALDLRYAGQYHEVRVEEVPEVELRETNLEALKGLFHGLHNRLYGYDLAAEETLVELVNVRLAAIGETDPIPPPTISAATGNITDTLKGARPMWQIGEDRFEDAPVYDGDRLVPGHRLEGPAIVESAVTTIVVPRSVSLTVDDLGTCVLDDRAGQGCHDG